MTTLAQQFAAEYARNAVPAMLKTIKTSKWKTRLIMTGVFATTYKHQADFLSADESIGVLGWAIPGINDLAMLTMVEILQTPAMDKRAKRGAAWMLGVCGSLSATINVVAPGSLLARFVFGLLVGIVVGLKLVTARIKPDFAELEQQEVQAVEVAAPVDELAEQRKADRRERDRQRRAAQREAEWAAAAEAERKAEERRERRRLARQVAELETSFAAADAPVSPAPDFRQYL